MRSAHALRQGASQGMDPRLAITGISRHTFDGASGTSPTCSGMSGFLRDSGPRPIESVECSKNLGNSDYNESIVYKRLEFEAGFLKAMSDEF